MAKTIEERIKDLHADIDTVVAAYVDERTTQTPGVPRGSVENSMLGRAHGCRCEELRIVQALITAAEKLAAQQNEQADAQALPTGQ
jgi:hypothetical protein